MRMRVLSLLRTNIGGDSDAEPLKESYLNLLSVDIFHSFHLFNYFFFS